MTGAAGTITGVAADWPGTNTVACTGALLDGKAAAVAVVAAAGGATGIPLD